MAKALYVEDNAADADLTRWALEQASPPIELDVVDSVREAIARLSDPHHPYSWLLLDLSLPDGDGFDVLRHVREQQMPLPVLAVSGSDDEQSVITALKLGADDYIIKADDYLDYLVDTLHTILSQKEYEQVLQPLRVLLMAQGHYSKAELEMMRTQPINVELAVVNDYREGMMHLSRGNFDVLLIDIDEGGKPMAALDVIKRLRAREEQAIPIIVIAAPGTVELAVQTLRLGVADYVLKDETFLQRLPSVIEAAYTRTRLSRVERQRENLRATHEAMQLAHQQKNRFVSELSHEVRTPLNGILGLLFLLKEKALPPEQQDLLVMAQQSGEYLLQVLNDTLDLSKIEAGHIELEERDFTLSALLENVKAVTAADLSHKPLQMSISVHPGTPDQLHGDAVRLEQIIVNLVSNAIKFTQQGEIEITVVGQPVTDKTVKLSLSVKDTGIGLTQEQQRSIFLPFKQADASITRRYGGTGLGLALTRELVTLMGGEIGVHSDVGVGSEFYCDVLLGHAAAADREDGSSLPTAAVVGGAMYHGRRVLLVEDNHINQIVTKAYLDHLQVDVDICDSGADAIELLRRQPCHYYDVMLLDLYMPGMDGFATAEAIRALPEFEQLPIIALTASVSGADQKRSRLVGMNDILNKPVSLASLHNKLANWLPEPEQTANG